MWWQHNINNNNSNNDNNNNINNNNNNNDIKWDAKCSKKIKRVCMNENRTPQTPLMLTHYSSDSDMG